MEVYVPFLFNSHYLGEMKPYIVDIPKEMDLYLSKRFC